MGFWNKPEEPKFNPNEDVNRIRDAQERVGNPRQPRYPGDEKVQDRMNKAQSERVKNAGERVERSQQRQTKSQGKPSGSGGRSPRFPRAANVARNTGNVIKNAGTKGFGYLKNVAGISPWLVRGGVVATGAAIGKGVAQGIADEENLETSATQSNRMRELYGDFAPPEGVIRNRMDSNYLDELGVAMEDFGSNTIRMAAEPFARKADEAYPGNNFQSYLPKDRPDRDFAEMTEYQERLAQDAFNLAGSREEGSKVVNAVNAMLNIVASPDFANRVANPDLTEAEFNNMNRELLDQILSTTDVNPQHLGAVMASLGATDLAEILLNPVSEFPETAEAETMRSTTPPAPGSMVEVPADEYIRNAREQEMSRRQLPGEDPDRPTPAAATVGVPDDLPEYEGLPLGEVTAPATREQEMLSITPDERPTERVEDPSRGVVPLPEREGQPTVNDISIYQSETDPYSFTDTNAQGFKNYITSGQREQGAGAPTDDSEANRRAVANLRMRTPNINTEAMLQAGANEQADQFDASMRDFNRMIADSQDVTFPEQSIRTIGRGQERAAEYSARLRDPAQRRVMDIQAQLKQQGGIPMMSASQLMSMDYPDRLAAITDMENRGQALVDKRMMTARQRGLLDKYADPDGRLRRDAEAGYRGARATLENARERAASTMRDQLTSQYMPDYSAFKDTRIEQYESGVTESARVNREHAENTAQETISRLAGANDSLARSMEDDFLNLVENPEALTPTQLNRVMGEIFSANAIMQIFSNKKDVPLPTARGQTIKQMFETGGWKLRSTRGSDVLQGSARSALIDNLVSAMSGGYLGSAGLETVIIEKDGKSMSVAEMIEDPLLMTAIGTGRLEKAQE